MCLTAVWNQDRPENISKPANFQYLPESGPE